MTSAKSARDEPQEMNSSLLSPVVRVTLHSSRARRLSGQKMMLMVSHVLPPPLPPNAKKCTFSGGSSSLQKLTQSLKLPVEPSSSLNVGGGLPLYI